LTQAGFALQLSGHFGLELAKVANDLRRLLRLLPVHMNPGQLVPAEGTHGLQFGVALERHHGFIEALLADQAQGQAVPGPVKFFVERQRLAEGRLGLIQATQLFAQEAEVEPARGVLRLD
jgi:hypothetical protein